MTKTDPKKINLLEHSEAKVKLYGRYLSEYLRVLYQAGFVKRVFIFDLFCGEGVYQNGDKAGSPIIAIENIVNHYQYLRQLLACNRLGNRVDSAQTGDLLENLG